MLVLPIINNGRVMNAEVRLKNVSKKRENVCYDDALPSEIIVNREKFSNSLFSKSNDPNATIDFIRSKSINFKRRFLVTTKSRSNSNAYDVYEVPQPPKSVRNLDNLYSKAIMDMRKEIPGSLKRGRYISLEDFGIEDQLSDEKIAKLQRIVKGHPKGEWPGLFEKAGIMEITDVISFLNSFECTLILDTTIPEVSLQETLKAMSALNTRDFKNLNKYYMTAQGNSRIYTRLSYANRLLNGQPLTLIRRESGKQLVMRKGNQLFDNYPRAA